MIRRPFSACLIGCLTFSAPVWVAPMTGCALMSQIEDQSPEAVYVRTNDAVSDTISVLRAARADNLISDRDWVDQVNPAIQSVSRVFDRWEMAVLSGDIAEQGYARLAAETALTELRLYAANLNRGDE